MMISRVSANKNMRGESDRNFARVAEHHQQRDLLTMIYQSAQVENVQADDTVPAKSR